MGRGVGEKAHLPTKRKGQADGVAVRDFDITGLDGPATDAIIAVLGAMGWGGRARLACGVMLMRTFHRLGRPANEGAGQDEAGQEGDEDRSHRLGHLNSRIQTPSLNGRGIPARVKQGGGPSRDVPKTPIHLILIGRHGGGS